MLADLGRARVDRALQEMVQASERQVRLYEGSMKALLRLYEGFI
jgi:hypothetical protein